MLTLRHSAAATAAITTTTTIIATDMTNKQQTPKRTTTTTTATTTRRRVRVSKNQKHKKDLAVAKSQLSNKTESKVEKNGCVGRRVCVRVCISVGQPKSKCFYFCRHRISERGRAKHGVYVMQAAPVNESSPQK